MSKSDFIKVLKLSNLEDELKIMSAYRYFSLVLTSVFYFAGNTNVLFKYKIMMITCLTVSAVILNYLYAINQSARKVIIGLVFIEIIGNTLILIPSGGLDSPYIWYSLNTIFVTLYSLNIYYCSISLFAYLIISSQMSFILLRKQNDINLFSHLYRNSNLLLSFILITVSSQLLFMLTKKLKAESRNLSIANERIKESMEHTMSLYRAVNSFTNLNNRKELFNLIIRYTVEITKAPSAYFCRLYDKDYMLEISYKATDDYRNMLLREIKKHWKYMTNSDTPVSFKSNNRNYIIVNIKKSNSIYGILGIEINNNHPLVFFKENIDQLSFLSSLISIVVERFELEEINRHLFINEEQNRIADEIHDSVLQKLFAVSIGLQTLALKLAGVLTPEQKEEFKFIRDSLNGAMRELRERVYGLSWKKKGVNAFEKDITDYIDEISRLNNVTISFNTEGNHQLINYELKNIIYRIICEGTGNAIRHGKCISVDIRLHIERDLIRLKIEDDGLGFDFNSNANNIKDAGMGLNNISSLVNLYSGDLKIETSIGKGTTINISLPNNKRIYMERGSAV